MKVVKSWFYAFLYIKMKDSFSNNISVSSFKTTLIISEIVITALVLIGFYLIFNQFSKKDKAFKNKQ